MSCGWTLSADAKLELVFFGQFTTGSNIDFVDVYDGSSSSARLINRFSGSSRPGPIVSSSNQLYVRFTSDGSSQHDGFKAIYRGTTCTVFYSDFFFPKGFPPQRRQHLKCITLYVYIAYVFVLSNVV